MIALLLHTPVIKYNPVWLIKTANESTTATTKTCIPITHYSSIHKLVDSLVTAHIAGVL